jgi:hypothetical protein
MRNELSDYEWAAIKPMLPTSSAAFGGKMTVANSHQSEFGYELMGPRPSSSTDLGSRPMHRRGRPAAHAQCNLVR